MTLDPAIRAQLEQKIFELCPRSYHRAHPDVPCPRCIEHLETAEAAYHLAASVTREQCAQIAESHRCLTPGGGTDWDCVCSGPITVAIRQAAPPPEGR